MTRFISRTVVSRAVVSRENNKGKGGNLPHYSQPLAFAPKFAPPHPLPNDKSQKFFIKNFTLEILD